MIEGMGRAQKSRAQSKYKQWALKPEAQASTSMYS